MSEYLWPMAVFGLVFGLGSLVFAYFVYLRSKRPHSKKKAEEQEKMDKKHGASGTMPKPPTDKKVEGGKGVKWPFIVAGAIAALLLVVWFWQSGTPPAPGAPSAPGTSWSWTPSIGAVWGWVAAGWVWIFILAFVALIASYFSKDEKSKALVAVAVMLPVIFAVLAISNTIWGEKSPEQPGRSQAKIPLASSPQSEWPPLFLQANGKEQIPILPGKRVTVAGYNFVLHTVYADGRDCSSACPDHNVVEVYVENKSATKNTVVYAYTPIQ